MAGSRKKAPGRTYHITYHSDGSSTVDCTYLCPYCGQYTADSFNANAAASDLLEIGGFYESLRCSSCANITNVRFWQCNKI